MKLLIILILILISLVVPSVCADALREGYKNIVVNNVITNINDFPDYVFITVGQLHPDMCPVQAVGSDGIIPDAYKFCANSVYAVKKSDFDENFIPDVEQAFKQANEKEYLSAMGAKEVIKNIHTVKEVPESSTQESITNYYTIDLGGVKEKPSEEPVKTVVGRNNLIYWYTFIPAVALFIIILLLVRKKTR